MLKNHLNHLKDNIFACFFKKYNRALFFLKRLIFIKIYKNGSLIPKEENIIKDTRNLKQEQNYAAVKDIRNLFRLHKEIKEIKDKVLRNIKNLLKYEKKEENYYKQVRVNNF